MGAANIANKQYLKGFLFLILEISWVAWLFTTGLKAYHNMITLGTHAQGLVYDKKLGIAVLKAGIIRCFCPVGDASSHDYGHVCALIPG